MVKRNQRMSWRCDYVYSMLKFTIIAYRVLENGVLIGQSIQADKEEFENHRRLNINHLTVGKLSTEVKDEPQMISKEPFNLMHQEAQEVCHVRENVKQNTINVQKEGRKRKRKECERYECSICQLHFAQRGYYKRHMVKHSDVRPFKCTICEKAFKRSSEMTSHMQIHSGVTYACETCNFTTRNKVSLRTHIRRVHQRDFPYRCGQCGKGFMSNYDLEDHRASHLDSKSFVCEYCGNMYSQKSYLIAHMRAIHGQKSEPKKYQCDLCSKSFASEHNLRNHASLHSQKFLCAQCGKEFATNHALELHNRKHTGERPYQCKLCSKAFARSVALRVHKLTHTGERPYICDICGKNFTQRSSMMAHRRKHPGDHPPPPPLLLSRLELRTQELH
ncbi:hypothetical protein P5V15_005118 [Pogonomyrmex californicus]